MIKSFNRFSIVYAIAMLLYFISIIGEFVTFHNAIKPLFMVLLMLFLNEQFRLKHSTFSKLILFGLFFSWIGDIALMVSKIGHFFIIGLGSFLIAHLGYSVAFYNNIRNSNKGFNYSKVAAYSILFLLVTVPFFYYIKDGLVFMRDGVEQNLTIPVLAYTIVITVMGMFSSWRHNHVNHKSFYWMLVGAVMFILSDCVLALNIFSIRPEPFSEMSKILRVTNMFLYLGGQFMIAVGAAYHSGKLSLNQGD